MFSLVGLSRHRVLHQGCGSGLERPWCRSRRVSALPAAKSRRTAVPCPTVRGLGILVAGAVTAAALAGCGAGDSTVAKTPERSVTVAPSPSAQAPASGDSAAVDSGAIACPGRLRPVCDQPGRARDRPGGRQPAARSPQRPGLEPRAGGRELQRVRAAVGGDRAGQHERRQSEHPRADVPPGQVHSQRRARRVRVQRRRILGEYRRHRGAEVLQWACPGWTASSGTAGTATTSNSSPTLRSRHPRVGRQCRWAVHTVTACSSPTTASFYSASDLAAAARCAYALLR